MPLCGRNSTPEAKPFVIVAKDDQVALDDTFRCKRAKPRAKERTTKAATAVTPCSYEMMDQAAPSVVTAKNSAHHAIGVCCNETEPWIPPEKLFDWARSIRRAEPNTRRFGPEFSGGSIVCDFKLTNGGSMHFVTPNKANRRAEGASGLSALLGVARNVPHRHRGGDESCAGIAYCASPPHA